MSRRLTLFFHGGCFDGTASAAVFAAFYRHRYSGARVTFVGLAHSDRDPFAGQAFDADDHACVDFRYHPRLSWWFDHHVSAFQPASRREAYEQLQSQQLVYDPTAQANTSMMATVLERDYGWRESRFDELVHWAHIIDGADYPDAKTAVALGTPATQLAAWLDHNADEALQTRYIELLSTRRLAEIVKLPWMAAALTPTLAAHARAVELMRLRARCESGVVVADFIGDKVTALNSFIAYWIFPMAQYAVCLTRDTERVKVSVGSNPWSLAPRLHNIAALCGQFGGGGHPFVGAVSLTPDRVLDARRAAAAIAKQLRSSPSLTPPSASNAPSE